ncbi:MAG TPA: response regulator [Caulobacteraceae bacterium]|nr:response regulator [Caulobacteraceae bacterium]
MAQVLVAEDEAFTALALVDELERLGHVVRDAPDGAAALEVMRSFAPDVLVTDLMMPKVDGAALIRKVKARPGPPIPVVLITGVPEVKLPQGLPYDAYIGKPVDYGKLGRTIDRLTKAAS